MNSPSTELAAQMNVRYAMVLPTTTDNFAGLAISCNLPVLRQIHVGPPALISPTRMVGIA